jgi:hypothetical protein
MTLSGSSPVGTAKRCRGATVSTQAINMDVAESRVIQCDTMTSWHGNYLLPHLKGFGYLVVSMSTTAVVVDILL